MYTYVYAISSPASLHISLICEWRSDTYQNVSVLCAHKSINNSKLIPAEGDYGNHNLSERTP